MTTERPTSQQAPDWLEAALAFANIPTLTCILVQMTGDRKWIEGDYVPSRPRGMDDNDTGGLTAELQTEIRLAAHEQISAWLSGQPLAIPDPDDALLVEMMGVSLREDIPSRYAPMIRHELGLDADTSRLTQTAPGLQLPAVPGAALAGLDIPNGYLAVIIGAGISGLCAAINFAAAGIPFTILERNHHLGGVWFENKYPGAACDVPSHLYSFSFASYDWSRFFASSDEIQNYLEYVADTFDIRRHIRFGHDVQAATFDEDSDTWQVDVINDSGQPVSVISNLLVSAVGAFNKPKYPNVEGLDQFLGQSAHTARWPEQGLDLAGKRVLVVGNGASAMQVVPAIADDVESLVVVQRSPQWGAPFPKFLKQVPDALQTLLSEVPLYRLWYRIRLSWAFNDKLYDALQKDPDWAHQERSVNALNDLHRRGLTNYIIAELGEAQQLLAEVVPQYPPFGKRLLMDNGWYRTVARDHVQLLTGAVNQVVSNGILLADGSKIEADVIIWATGFDVVNFLAPMTVRGIGGRDLHQEWQGDDARAYLGTVVSGFPNFFCLYGPNTQFGHGGSLISIVERQIKYLMSLLHKMLSSNIASVDVRREVYDAYAAEVDRKHENMIWTHPGMSTYYRNSQGRVVVCNPFKIIEFWEMTESANLEDYLIHCTNNGPVPKRPEH